MPLQCRASSKPARTAGGMVRSSCAAWSARPSIVQQRALAGRRDLAGVELVARVEGGLDRLQGRVERAEEAPARTPSARPCRARPRAARHTCWVSADHLLGDLADQRAPAPGPSCRSPGGHAARRHRHGRTCRRRGRGGPGRRGTRRCSRRGSRAGPPCPRRRGSGRLSPFMLPSRPTDFLRISQMRPTSFSPRATVKPRRPRSGPSRRALRSCGAAAPRPPPRYRRRTRPG